MSTRVLLADPDRHLLTAYKGCLSSDGFDVATARDGLECIDTLRRFLPEVLVLEPEILWGGGDGVVAMVHEAPETPKVPVILLLTYGSSFTVLYNIARFPISDYQVKPMDGWRLAQWIRSVLARREEEPMKHAASPMGS